MTWSRREFLRIGGTCFAHMAALSAAMPGAARRLWAAGPRGVQVAREPWGSLEQVADGVWALISSPLEDRTTLCNGGIVAGSRGVALVESFASPAGAAWMSEQARSLTGRWPTHAVVTHYHGDHSGGITGLDDPDASTALLLSPATRALLVEGDAARDGGAPPDRVRALEDAQLLGPGGPTELDLGGRTIQIIPRSGHTASDVSVELDAPSVVFCGDLVWNDMFPNYVDAVPTRLSTSVRSLIRDAATTYVPGHGPLADNAALARYLTVIDSVEEAARDAHRAGIPAADAAREFSLPESVGEWMLFNPAYFERALLAWERELGGGG